ncbi:MAG: hypothetical protein AB7S92_17480 [Parvibaculaceae bacterium]
MANIMRFVGVIGIVAGLVLIAVAAAPLVQGQPFALAGSALLTQALVAISAGVIVLGLGQLIALNDRLADSMEGFLDYMRGEDEAGAPPAGSARDIFANVPDYSPRRDPPIVKEGTYRDHTVLTLEDGTVAVQTTAGWKRFRRIRDFDRLLTA